MNEIELKTCIKFKSRTNEKNYVKIYNAHSCWSDIGYMEYGEQYLSLHLPNCSCHGIILHELMHTLGFLHIHQRSDRKNYLTIHWNNINRTDRMRF
ncbi:Astacin-like metalloprotease toxin, partial [Dinothrombium tinctorium]